MLRREQVQQEVDNLLLLYPQLAEDEDLRRDMLEGSTSFMEYLILLTKRIGETKNAIAGTKIWRDEILQRVERLEQQHAFYRAVIFRLMERADLHKIPLDIATLRVQAGTRKVVITDDKLVPDSLCRIERYPNKSVIAEILKNGNPVPGAELSNSEPHLVVSFK